MITPLFDRVLVQLVEPGTTPGGLVIPDTYQDSTPRGRVLAVGCGEVLQGGGYRSPVVQVGDVVVLDGKGIIVDGPAKTFLVRESQCLAIVGAN